MKYIMSLSIAVNINKIIEIIKHFNFLQHTIKIIYFTQTCLIIINFKYY